MLFNRKENQFDLIFYISFSIDHIVLNIQQSLCIIQPNPRRQLNLDVVQVDESSALVMISSAIMKIFEFL